jgi:hypothetical protein
MTLKTAQQKLRAIGVNLKKVDGEYFVNFAAGKEATAYYMEDLLDAVDTGEDMVKIPNTERSRN